MNIDRLRYFAAVVETRNLRKASELVGISPASMSKAISTLEEELGLELTRPEGRGIEITAKGLEIYRSSSSLLEEFRRFQAKAAEREIPGQRLKIATFEVFSSYFLSSFLARELPDWQALVLEQTPGAMERDVLEGLVDFGLTYLPSAHPALAFQEVGSFRMHCFGRPEWAKRPFGEWEFSVPTTELRIHSLAEDSLDLWPAAAPRRRVKYEFELLETALQTAGQGLSVLHCPDFIVKLYNEQVRPGLKLEQLEAPAGYKAAKPVKVYLISKKGESPGSLEGKLAKFFRSLGSA
ncbi:MAG: LysR family transcriptional regulator [Bdellovibrionota bacterium]